MLRLVLCLCLGLGAAPAAADVFTFATPSGNIECSVGVGEGPSDIMCTIYAREGATALPKPGSCGGIWGHDFELRSSGPATMTCRDRALGKPGGAFEVVPYGQRSGFDPNLVCTATQKGLECRNGDGHGFFLSRARQSVF